MATAIEPITADIRMPRIGAWQADIATDADKLPSGQITIRVGALEFVGTVVPTLSGTDGGRAPVHVVGGAGGLSKSLPAKSYVLAAGVQVRTVVADLLRETGEALSPTAEQATLDRRVPRWHRSEGLASHALTDLADAVQCGWRVLRDGTIWIGPETYPAAPAFEHTVLNEDWSVGIVTLGAETAALEPGTTFSGMKVELVIHKLGRNLRTEAHASAPNLHRQLAQIRRAVDYARLYPSKVTAQNEDGTLQLLPDDPVMQARGVDKVPIRHGIPGASVTVTPGARVMLGFAAGDPAQPFATAWDEGGHDSITRVDFGEAPQNGARQGDGVEVPLPPAVFSGTIAGSPATGVLTFPAMKSVGVVTGGTPKYRFGT